MGESGKKVPPKKVDEDIIRQLICKFFPHNVYRRGGIKDRLLNNQGGVRDVDFPEAGWDLFNHFHRRRKEKVPLQNPWVLELSKIKRNIYLWTLISLIY